MRAGASHSLFELNVMQENTIFIKSLDMDARGVGHLENEDGSQGKVVFVEGALPGETVRFTTFKKKKNWEMARMDELLRESPMRVTPKCPHFDMCGGCSMQHLEPTAQVAIKQRVLEDNLQHIGKVRPLTVMRPMYGPTWGYRYRARLSVRHVAKKNTVLVGFKEKRSIFVADIQSCQILPKHVSDLLLPLRALIGSLTLFDQVPQIEVAIGEGVTALVLRIMSPLGAGDDVKLKAFADQHQVQFWLQTKGPETAAPYYPLGPELYYLLPEFGIKMPFKPVDFTQVNHYINRVLVAKALRLLEVQPEDRVADLFCGLGNFTLPIARRVAEVVGVEGEHGLVERAAQNAARNRIDNARFHVANLFEDQRAADWARQPWDKMLLDPPRAGADKVLEYLPHKQTRRIVYVSCHPASLARDAGILVNQHGFTLKSAGVMDMFPHTAHVESIALFER